MSRPATPVMVVRWGERRRESQLPALIVTVGHWDAGVAVRTTEGWTAHQRPRGPFGRFRKHQESEHSSAHAAVAAIMRGPYARSRGASPWSEIRFTDAAGRASRDAWGLVAS